MKPLHECTFYTRRNEDDGTCTGHCQEWPDLRTRPYRNALDALDDITAQVAKKLRQLHGTQPIDREASA